MNAEVQATGVCERCGDFRVAATVLTIRHCVDDDSWSYRLRCPSCGMVVFAPIAGRIARRSLEAGASLETWTLPVTSREFGVGAVVSLDDLDDLLIDLEQPDVIEILRASLGVA